MEMILTSEINHIIITDTFTLETGRTFPGCLSARDDQETKFWAGGYKQKSEGRFWKCFCFPN